MGDFVELGATAFDHVVENHGEDLYEKVQTYNPLSSRYGSKRDSPKRSSQDAVNDDQNQSVRSSRRSQDKRPHHRHQTELPSPERERDQQYYPAPPADDRDFERQSLISERVLRNYENETDDRLRRPKDSQRRYNNNNTRSQQSKMAYAYDDRRGSSRDPPRGRYEDDDSDYDEHTGRKHRSSGRGYDQDRRDRDYDREIIETEVYRGPPREWADQRSPSYQENGEYAVAQYRSDGDLAPYDSKRRSRSRGHREKERDRDDYRGEDRDEGIRGKLEETFDTSAQGVGAGIAGAIVGGLAARQFGDKRKNKRDMVIGAIVGGLAVNAAEQKYRDWRKDKEDERDERYEGRDSRSRSAMR